MKKNAGLILLAAAVLFLIFTVLQKDEEKKSDILNVKEYGAEGNGKTDDTEAIQKALDEGSYKKVYLPKGNYKISQALKVKEQTEVYSEGASIFSGSGLDSVIRVNGDHVHIHDLTVDGKSRTLKGITVEAGSSHTHVSKSILQNFNQPENSELSRQTVAAFRVEGSTNHTTLDQSRINNVMARNPIKGWEHHVSRGVLISPASKEQTTAKNVTVSNTSFSGIGPKDDGDGIVVQGFKGNVGLTVTANTFTNVHKRAIKIQSPGAVIQKNTIYNSFRKNNHYTTYYDPHKYDMWAAVSVYADDVSIKQNSISGSGDYGRIIDVSNASNILIESNYIENGRKGNYADSSVVYITADRKGDSSNITVANNTLANGRYGIFADRNSTKITASNNRPINVKDYQNKALKKKAAELAEE
ncbi:right-handed parallel beta-helix repeat-containing protein [Metabacillus mangrovi]|uniref:right-handed parallel beta-helix repeat-containing protein n=1 Tax=Metabacillus mangrovi TaxID=1491830 RepID=UPI001391FC5A|nr:right-handed parallel beta-helix repeat-containing protein [Metabacillus mangrovi]